MHKILLLLSLFFTLAANPDAQYSFGFTAKFGQVR
jgi:hypothetical protein